jgi:hypothetical protein
MKSSVPRLFFARDIFIIHYFPYSLLVCSYFLFLHYPVLVHCKSLEMYLFLLGYPFVCYIIISTSLLWSFVFLTYQF